jgi:hypothetical protein
VVDDRSERKSTVVASQLPIEDWHGLIADATVADAILDRWVHRAHRITLHGDSLRRVQARQEVGDGPRGMDPYLGARKGGAGCGPVTAARCDGRFT